MKKKKWNDSKRKKREAEEDVDGGWRGGKSVFPVFLDREAPIPGKMIVFVVIGELGLYVVCAADKHPFGRLLHGGEELVFLVWSGTVAADHVLCLVD